MKKFVYSTFVIEFMEAKNSKIRFKITSYIFIVIKNIVTFNFNVLF